MSWLPLFFKPASKQIVVLGCGAKAARKIRFLQRFDFPIVVLRESAESNLAELDQSRIVFRDLKLSPEGAHARDEQTKEVLQDVLKDAMFAVAATGSPLDHEFAAAAREAGVPVHIAENVSESDFLFPSFIDRGSISVAISSSGQHPTLTRLVRSRVESVLPSRLEQLGKLALEFRESVRNKLPNLNDRRSFWERHFEGRFANLVFTGQDEQARQLIEENIRRLGKREATSEVGEVYLVGAGPGDPDLLSFKALRLMRQADVVLYDRLVSQDILNLVRQDADMIDVGKRRSNHTLPQEGINDLLAKLALEGKRVLRLKGGDPFIFGRGGEEIETLAEHGVPFQVVPGITAAAGCASYSGIPLTHRDYAQSVRFVTGHLKSNSSDLVWKDLVGDQQTLVFYMGLVALPQIATELINHGLPASTPVAVISKGTLPEQRIVVGQLDSIAADVYAAQLKAPTIIIVGEVVRLHAKLRWTD